MPLLPHELERPISNADIINQEIDYLLHTVLRSNFLVKEWNRLRRDLTANVHPFVRMAETVHKQIQEFSDQKTFGMTEEIFELSELAVLINLLHSKNIVGLRARLNKLISPDYSLYYPARYEIQIGGILLKKGLNVRFIPESKTKSPDILVSCDFGCCEIECKHKEVSIDQMDYVKSIYNNTQSARKQFTKKYPGIICIEIDKMHYDEFQQENQRLSDEIRRALRNSKSISAIMLTSKILFQDSTDYVYRHRVVGYDNPYARYPFPDWLRMNWINVME